MPSKKSPKGQRAREIKAVRILRDNGLISKTVKLNRKPSGPVKRALRKFADVIAGKAVVMKVPKSVARGLKPSHRVKGDLVVIDKQKGERLRYDSKSEKIIGTRKKGSRTFTRTIERDVSTIKPPKAGLKRYYVMPFQRGQGDIDYLKFDDIDELKNFMGEYEKRGWKNWKNYIEVVDVESRAELEEEYPSLDGYFYNTAGRRKRGSRTTSAKHKRRTGRG